MSKVTAEVSVGYGLDEHNQPVITLHLADSKITLSPIRAEHMALQILTTLKLMESVEAADREPT